MSRVFSQLKTWGPPVVSMCAVICATGYAFSKKSSAAEGIQTLASLGTSLTAVANQAMEGVLSPKDAALLDAEKQELENRLRDSLKSPHVVAAISETTRRVGADVHEIKPVKVSGASKPPAGARAYPQYEVTLDGSYRQIAEFLGACARERLPTRAVSFLISRSDARKGTNHPELRARITVETFQPPEAADQSPKGGA
ncbi:MAG: hypothetical protein O7F76_12470 [Planctomycetota bacterium]|nr:hypothetical protein [Planctomycetota bacterium]MCZ6817493.1 hypothetical protein [Planctomycetota bacterium]